MLDPDGETRGPAGSRPAAVRTPDLALAEGRVAKRKAWGVGGWALQQDMFHRVMGFWWG